MTMDTPSPAGRPPGLPEFPPATTRFDVVDLIRGVAVCGILVMNIVAFGMPAAAYLNPQAYMGDRLSSHLIYGFTHIFADQKFMGLFSLLFGSSVMLFIHKLRARGVPSLPFSYLRNWWLLVFGFLHGYFLWEGDILLYYALCSFLLYPLWRLPPTLQCAAGLLIFLSAIALDLSGQRALDEMADFSLANLEPTWAPSEQDVAFETTVRLSGYAEQLSFRTAFPEHLTDPAMNLVSRVYVAQGLARAFGLMLVGMAFYSWGIVTGQRSKIFYRRAAIWGLGVGVFLAGFGLWRNYAHDWDIRYGLFAGLAYNHLATPPLVIGYLCGMVVLWQNGVSGLGHGLRSVGRMAFTNYIGQSVICTGIFYGYGLALFGQLDRLQLMGVVVAIWIIQIGFSLLWLSHFRYGPLEWLWRGLTFFRLPILRLHNR
ncbi:DUF418 domain-containing protein [Gilvimarinus sp. F26214L]|uniref:DUF418 domain-containing protein n=1 Tax=Gilvimarinus sp. DZF01 TaxID=3461371 RepID=UPI0040453E4F